MQWVVSDPTESGVLVTNSNATSLMRRHFEPFGWVVHETAIAGTWPRRQFAGHLDDGIGLYDRGPARLRPAGEQLRVRVLEQPPLELPKSLLPVRPFAARPPLDALQVHRMDRRDS